MAAACPPRRADFAYAAAMVELLCFWLSRIGGAWLELRLLRSSDGGFRVAVMLAALVVLACLVALALQA